MLRAMTTLIWLFLAGCADAPAADPAAEAPPAAPAPAPAPAGDAVLAQGTITLPEGSTATGKAVFVSLRAAGVPGPPLAAKKLPPGPFPLAFTLTEADRPMVNGPVPDSFDLKVTLDADGDPMSKTAEDLELVQTATRGATDLAVELAPRP
jgi:hypothetical protein